MSTLKSSEPSPALQTELPSVPAKKGSPESRTIRQFFDSIAFRYDFLNLILSFNKDDEWRKESRELILDRKHRSILDLGMGTGKFLKVFLKDRKWERCAGLDFSLPMLEAARRRFPSRVRCINGDFLNLPFKPESFDLVISAFTLRSVKNMDAFLSEIYQLLTKDGRAAFLCLTRPTNFFFKLVYYPYLKIYLPLVGGLLSGNFKAYQFLSDSILSFQEPEETAAMMFKLGFRRIQTHRFTYGAATLIMGSK